MMNKTPKTCHGCENLLTEITDFNYYGETEKRTKCTKFNCVIKQGIPCEPCREQEDTAESVAEKYANYLVRKIEQLNSKMVTTILSEYRSMLEQIFCDQKCLESVRVLLFNALAQAESSILEKYKDAICSN